MEVLGIRIDDINQQQALEKVESFLQSKSKHYIVTPNPEIIMAAQQDIDLQNILNDADLSIPDGVGLKLAGVKNRIPGIDLMLDLVEFACEKGYSIGLIGGAEGVAKKAAEVLQKNYPSLKITFADDGGMINEEGLRINELERNHQSLIVNYYSLLKTDILFVGFGHGKQEKWIARNVDKLPVKVAMTVGGSLDYISGAVPRAPKLVRDLGFEWLFRLVMQPWRINRQFALIQFVWLLVTRMVTRIFF